MSNRTLVASLVLTLPALHAFAAPFTVSGGGISITLPGGPPLVADVALPNGTTIPATTFLQGGVGMTSGLSDSAIGVPGLYDALSAMTVIGGRAGVRDWVNDPQSDTDTEGRNPYWIGPLLHNDPSYGWATRGGWAAHSSAHEFHRAFASAPGVINGTEAELYWMGQIALPAGVEFNPSTDPLERAAEAVVNATPEDSFQHLKFYTRDFIEHVDGSWSSSTRNEFRPSVDDATYWYTFHREPVVDGVQIYSLYLSDRPITLDPVSAIDTPSPGALALLLASPIALRPRR